MIYQDLKNNSCPSAALAHRTSIVGVNSSLITRPIVCYLWPEARSNNFYDLKMWWEMTQLPMGQAECIVVTKLRVPRTTGPELTMAPPFHCCRHWRLSWLWSWLLLSAPD